MSKENQLDPYTLDLINQLCTRVGMIMEDAAPLALRSSRADEETATKLRGLNKYAVSISALITAARALANV